MIGDLPEVPRDQAFWNTYHAVNAEFDRKARRAECLRNGHLMCFTSREPTYCERCYAGMTQMLYDEEHVFGRSVTKIYDEKTGDEIGVRISFP